MLQATPPTLAFGLYLKQTSPPKDDPGVIFSNSVEAKRFEETVLANPHLGYTLKPLDRKEMRVVNNYTYYYPYAKPAEYIVFYEGNPDTIEKTFNLVPNQNYNGLNITG
ncbi:MAG: hypothetical protein U0003_04925 [Vampirovibrionales bacterium]